MNIGAFMDWGLEKHFLVPFREQRIQNAGGPMVCGLLLFG